MFSYYAVWLRAELLEQHQAFKAGRWEYCKAVSKRHYKRVRDVLCVQGLMNTIGFMLLILLVSLGLPKRYGNMAAGAIMFPLGWALNRFIVFRDQYGQQQLGWRDVKSIAKWRSYKPQLDQRSVDDVAHLPSKLVVICRGRYRKLFDDEFDDSERWVAKVLLFAFLGQGIYYAFVAWLGWTYWEVRVEQMFLLGPISWGANYWVFKRRVKKAEEAIAVNPTNAVVDMG